MNLALRSPQFKSKIVASGVQSIVLTLSTDAFGSVIQIYQIIQNVTSNTTANFDISELVRDYLTISYKTNYVPDTIGITSSLQAFALPNGGGATVGSPDVSTDLGFEAYGTFEEGINPSLPFTSSLDGGPAFLLFPNLKDGIRKYEINVPVGAAGYVPYLNTDRTFNVQSYAASTTSATIGGPGVNFNATLKINRIDCTKYGAGTKIIFINKYGVQQDLWFFLRKDETLGRTNTKYNSNILETPFNAGANYSIKDAATKVLNTRGSKKVTLNSGYYPENQVEYFEELLLSEYVWMQVPLRGAISQNQSIVPMTVSSSSIAVKTSLGERLIEYRIDFEQAFDYINNVR